jgi:hypothetical protein
VTKLDHALAWAARGFKIFPCVPNGKSPQWGRYWEHATTDPDVIRSWWQDQSTGAIRDYNIGVSTTGGTAVVDIDTKHGPQALENYYSIGGHFETLTVQTWSGGFHTYLDPGRDIANSQGSLVKDVDVRGFHGVALAPGSTINGVEYKLVVDKPIAPMPEAMLRLCKAPAQRDAPAQWAVPELDTPGMVANAAEYLGRVAPAVEGQGGDNQTYQVACRARDLGVTEETCLELMDMHFNPRCEPPWDYDALVAKIHNAYVYAENAPGARSAEAVFAQLSLPQFDQTAGQDGALLLTDDRNVSGEAPLIVNEDRTGSPHNGVEYSGAGEQLTLRFGNAILPAQMRRRPWIVKNMLERGELTLFIAPGGAGKSVFILHTAIMLALGIDVCGSGNMVGRAGSVIYNAEDSLDEMSGRLLGACMQLGVDYREVASYIILISGKTHGKMNLVRIVDGAPKLNEEAAQILVKLCSNEGVAFLALDPLARLHNCNENDNNQMTAVIDELVQIATRAGVALGVPHHLAKPPQAGYQGHAGNPYSARGAGAIIEASRVAITLSAPTEDDMTTYNLHLAPEHRQRLIRLDDAKLNRGLMRGEPVWMRKETVILPHGEDTVALAAVDMQGFADAMRQKVGTALYVEASNAAVASFSLADAAGMLMRYDVMWGKLQPQTVRQRLEMMLTQPIALSDGGRIALQMTGKGKFVVYE